MSENLPALAWCIACFDQEDRVLCEVARADGFSVAYAAFVAARFQHRTQHCIRMIDGRGRVVKQSVRGRDRR